MIRAASFDIWLTLIRSNPGFKEARNELLRQAVAPNVGPLEFAAALRAADVEADHLAEQTGRNLDLADRLRLACTKLAVDMDLSGGMVARLRAEQHTIALALPPVLMHESVPELLAELAAHIPLAITSNTGMIPAGTMRALLDHLGLIDSFAVATFSDEVGYAKPDPRIFHATLVGLAELTVRHLGGTVVHVGDNPHADVDGATASGLQPVLVGPDAPIEDALAGFIRHARTGAAA